MPKRAPEPANETGKAKKKNKTDPQGRISPSVEVKHGTEAAAATCRERFEGYILNWIREVNGTRYSPPSSMPPVAPLPTILDVMMPSSSHTPPLPATVTATLVDGAPTQQTVKGTGVVYDNVMLLHESSDPTDYERPGRLTRTLDHLNAIGLMALCHRIPRRLARTKDLRLVHTAGHIDSVDQLEFAALLRKPDDTCSVGQDLYANAATSKAARMAAGCVIAAALDVVRGEVRNAFALVRPPGHHASKNSASGFCFFNNVAVAVRVAQQELQQCGVTAEPRALVLDWDVHHGDGTESIFYEDPSVVVVSIHQHGSGRGHVLRKPPSVFTDTIDVNALAVLMEATTAADANTNDNGKNGSSSEKSEMQYKNESQEEEDGIGQQRRQRKPVDYAEMAAAMEEDDNAVARMFGVEPDELRNSDFSSSRSSNDGGNHSSVLSSSDVVGKRLPGDTDGVSFDDNVGHDTEGTFYPGTGHINRIGGDENAAARGKNINIPWPTAGMGDIEYLQVLLDIVVPVILEYRPDIVFISCGFDSASGDLLGSMRLSASGYYLLTKALAAVSPRLVVALEGGYHLSNVARCTEAVLRALLEASGSMPLTRSEMLWCQTEDLVKQVRDTHQSYWRCFSTQERGEKEKK